MAWFLVPTALILGLVALFTFYTYQRVTEELVLERNSKIVRLQAEQLREEIFAYIRQLSTLSAAPEINLFDPFVQGAFLSENLLTAFDGGVVILDVSGKVVAADPRRWDAVGQDWSGREYFRLMVQAPQTLSGVVTLEPEGVDVIILAVPVSNGRGFIAGMFRLDGIARLGSPGAAFYDSMIKLLGRGEDGPVYLVDGKGRLVYHSDHARIGEDVAAQEVVGRALAGETGSVRTRDREGREIIASFAPVMQEPRTGASAPDLPSHKTPGLAAPLSAPKFGKLTTSWGLVTEERWDKVMRASQGYRRFLLLLLGSGALVPALVIAWGARRITQPIAELSGAAQEVAGGHLDQLIEVRTGDELEALAEQFNRMSAQLRASYANLEQRVAHRTRELATLNAVAAVASRSLDLETVLQDALDKTLEVMTLEMGTAYRLEQDGQTLSLMAQRGYSGPFLRHAAQLHFWATKRPTVVQLSDYPPSESKALLKREGVYTVISIPLVAKGEVLGVINLGSRRVREATPEELALLAAIGQQIGVAVENARLYEQAEGAAVAAERNRLARDLHDAVSQTLFSASLVADVLPRLWERDPGEGRRRLTELRELTRGALAEMRTLLLELRPSALIEAEMDELLRQLTQSITGRARVPVALQVEGECALPPDVKVALYRIAQESLNNVAKHAGASRATVRLRCAPDEVELHINDDGRGFDVSNIPPNHLGVGVMRERAETIGATLQIKSQIGQGTRVMVTWMGERTKDE
jgi:nitrate/nitrite-specific signal transduction histidine kinase